MKFHIAGGTSERPRSKGLGAFRAHLKIPTCRHAPKARAENGFLGLGFCMGTEWVCKGVLSVVFWVLQIRVFLTGRF